jgi:hypothetical protein
MPLGSALVKPKKITVTFGRRIVFDPALHAGKEARGKLVAELTESLRALESPAS